MTLTKGQIAEQVWTKIGHPKRRSAELVDSVFEIIKETLESGESVLISGFGKFCVHQKGERRGRNPQTGKPIMLEPRKVVTFRCSSKLRDRISGGSMTDENLKDFQKRKEEFKKQNNIITETIKMKKENIGKEADNIRLLEKYYRKHKYIGVMYEDVSEDQIRSMNDDQYSSFVMPLRSSGVSGETTYVLYDETKKAGYIYDQHFNITTSLDLSASGDSTSVHSFATYQPQWFPNRDRITAEYEIEDEIDKHIDFVGRELSRSFPDLKQDYDAFIKKFHSFRYDKSQYQDLIGSRSLFFFKLIFDFSKRTYGVEHPRIEAIRRFVFGSASPLVSTEPIIKTCRDIYSELSSQDASGMSVKLGSVIPAYVESLFRRLIGNIAAILNLRKRHYHP